MDELRKEQKKEIIGIGTWSNGDIFIVFKTHGTTICWTPPNWKILTLVDILEAFANLSPDKSYYGSSEAHTV